MKLLRLADAEQQTLREMGIFHNHARTRMRAQAILRLSQGMTLKQTADEFNVHLNSVEQWRRRWSEFGLVGIYERPRSGRPTKWTVAQQQALGELSGSKTVSGAALLEHVQQQHGAADISAATAKRYLRRLRGNADRNLAALQKKE